MHQKVFFFPNFFFFGVGKTTALSCTFVVQTFVPNAPALFAYAERAAVLGGAQLLVVLQTEDDPSFGTLAFRLRYMSSCCVHMDYSRVWDVYKYRYDTGVII